MLVLYTNVKQAMLLSNFVEESLEFQILQK